MIVLDTNVLSELVKPAPQRSETVFAWLAQQPGERMFTTAITAAELLSGVAIMPEGARKRAVGDGLTRIIALFEGRILAFDQAAARHYAEAVTARRKSGRLIDAFDLLIGATARANGMAVATRNIYDFEDSGVDLINPWDG